MNTGRGDCDFRLEVDGVLKSWAVPKGPSMNPSQRRLAVAVPDHPLEYICFEGVIPAGQYGAGGVIIWDCGTFETVGNEPPAVQLRRGELVFVLHGAKLHGGFALVRLARGAGTDWLLIKRRDRDADTGWQVTSTLPTRRRRAALGQRSPSSAGR
jgi:DNA ligase D-like protein (predicted 3'-phosphoesterase)